MERIDGGKSYFCGGFIDEVFVNCSAQLDNLLLDAMEPYDLDDLTEFDFAYVAGHQVKTDDISGKQLEKRISAEVSASYSPVVQNEGGPFRRQNGVLAQDAQPRERPATSPVFFETLGGKRREVVLKFSTPWRIIRMALLVLFLPVVIALFINGFHFSEINLGGSAAWFCIFVPVIPIYLLKFGRIDMYDRPWFYIVSENGTRIRYREKRETPSGKETLKIAGRLLFGWPIGLAVWFGILAFLTMCGLTAGIFIV